MYDGISESVWCVPGFGAGFEITLEPLTLQKEGEKPREGHSFFCAKLWYAANLVQKRSEDRYVVTYRWSCHDYRMFFFGG